MKIVFSNFDDRSNPDYGGGGAFAIHEVAKRLAKQHSVTVITGAYANAKNEIIDGVQYKRIGSNLFGAKAGQLIFQWSLPWQAATMDCDIWLESFTPPYSTAFLPWFTKKPVIGVTHLLPGVNMYKKYHIPFHIIERFGFKFYKHFIVLTEELKRQIALSNRHAVIDVVPNGVDQQLIDLEFEKRGEHALFLGRIDKEQKGLDLLLKAYKTVSAKISDTLVIAGSGSKADVTWLKEQIKTLSLEDKVRYIGRVSGSEKDEIYKKAKYLVMSSRFEALPLTIFEAFCYKCPIVYFNIPELDWIPDRLGQKIKPFESAAFGNAMLRLSLNPDDCKRKGDEAKIYVKNMSWATTADKYQSIINSAADIK